MTNLTMSMEDLAFMGTALHISLTKAVEFLRKDGSYSTKAIHESNIIRSVYLSTGMYIDFLIEKHVGFNAYALLPSVDKNHIFVKEVYRGYSSGETGDVLINTLGKAAQGSVNPKTGYVDGVFQKIKIDISLGHALISSSKFTPAEVSAIILHELGHAYTYFYHLGTVVKTALVSSVAAKSVMEGQDMTTKVKVLKSAERTLGIEIRNKEELATSDQKGGAVVQTVILSAAAEKTRSESGYTAYELRSVEQIADGFAVRHGAGADLVLALEKLAQMHGNRATYNTAQHLFMEAIKIIFFSISLMVMPLSMIAYVLLASPHLKSYDDPEARARLVKQNMVAELKNPCLPDARRRAIIDDIAVVEQVEKSLDDKMTFLELFWGTIMPSGVRALNQQDTQKQIEKMINNDLFLKSQQLRG